MVDFNAQTPRLTKKVQGIDLSFPAPYTEGHALTANEAAALNGLLGENIRNNCAKHVQDAIDETAKNGGSVDVAALQDHINKYAAGYEFGTSRVVDPVVKIARELGEARIKLAAEAKGRKLSADELKALVEQYATREDVMAEAAKEFKHRQSAVSKVGDLGLDF